MLGIAVKDITSFKEVERLTKKGYKIKGLVINNCPFMLIWR